MTVFDMGANLNTSEYNFLADTMRSRKMMALMRKGATINFDVSVGWECDSWPELMDLAPTTPKTICVESPIDDYQTPVRKVRFE